MILCVSGMHRSGTSLTASWLIQCGLALHDGAVGGPAPGNPHGHFEDIDFVSLHASAMRRTDPGSSGWKVSASDFLTFTESERRSALELLARRSDRPSWGWKDPRSVYFLEQWKTLAPGLKVLLLWRSRGEVVDSLVRRARLDGNGSYVVSPAEAAELWRRHNELACRYKQRHPEDTLLVPLRRLLRDDRCVFRCLSDRFGPSLSYRALIDILDPGLLSGGEGAALGAGPRCDGIGVTLEETLWQLSDLA